MDEPILIGFHTAVSPVHTYGAMHTSVGARKLQGFMASEANFPRDVEDQTDKHAAVTH